VYDYVYEYVRMSLDRISHTTNWDEQISQICLFTVLGHFFFFFSGTVRRASARPYYDMTQRNHTQSPASDVAHLTHLAMLTAKIKGRVQGIGH
jgi:hypothetical protein